MGFRETLIDAILLGLFSFSFLYFIYYMSLYNGGDSVMQDPTLNKTFNSLNRTLSDNQFVAQTELNATNSEPAQVGFGSLVLTSVLGAGRIFTGFITSTYNIIQIMAVEKMHIPNIVFNALLTIVIVSIIFLSWRLYRSGF